MAGQRILLVDDQAEVREPIRIRLESEGYVVAVAGDGAQALELYQQLQPDLVILDVMLPVQDGFTVCRQIRSQSQVPILILSGKAEETDIIVGLELGADDYLPKPFRLNELLARVRAHLRRAPHPAEEHVGADGLLHGREIVLNPASRQVTLRGAPLPVTPLEFRVLEELLRAAGTPVARETLLQRVWGYEGYDVGIVNTLVKRLRMKIERDPANPEVLVTVRGFGYMITV
jgi:DNA-binding response OmpR family regulator